MLVGFLNNQIDGRGTGNAVFNYAHYNETILGNKSRILTFPNAVNDPLMEEKIKARFGKYYTLDSIPTDLDVIYHIKYGNDIENSVNVPGVRYVVHAVFEGNRPHGDRYAAVSEWMGQRDSIPWVPHITRVADTNLDYRKALGIPKEAAVIGRLGGHDSFDIPWVWSAIENTLINRPKDDIWFLFLNTARHEYISNKYPNILHFDSTQDDYVKRAFINTCDAMLHARSRGETFGISVGEFAILGKPIFTFDGSYEKAHIFELRGTARTYTDENDLSDQLVAFRHGETNHPFYDRFTPEMVMQKFKEVFLEAD